MMHLSPFDHKHCLSTHDVLSIGTWDVGAGSTPALPNEFGLLLQRPALPRTRRHKADTYISACGTQQSVGTFKRSGGQEAATIRGRRRRLEPIFNCELRNSRRNDRSRTIQTAVVRNESGGTDRWSITRS